MRIEKKLKEDSKPYAWTTREASIEDAGAIWQLHREVYYPLTAINRPGLLWDNDPHSIWQWWMLDNPTAKGYSYVAEDNGHIIGHMANIGVWYNVQGKKVLGAYAWGALTQMDYRNQGIYQYLREKLTEFRPKSGVLFATGMASSLGERVYRSQGTNMLGRSDFLVKILNPKSVIFKRTHSKVLSSISGILIKMTLNLLSILKMGRKKRKLGHVFEVEYFDERFDQLWMKLKDSVKFSYWKDSTYLNWRYLKRPNVKYQIIAVEEESVVYGYIVLRLVDNVYNVGHVVDFFCLPGKEGYASNLIDFGITYLKEKGADIVYCLLLQNNPYYQLFKEKIFIRRGYSGMWILGKEIDIPNPGIRDINNWYLMHGDTDTI